MGGKKILTWTPLEVGFFIFTKYSPLTIVPIGRRLERFACRAYIVNDTFELAGF